MSHLQEAKDANDATRELLAGDLQAFQLYRIAHALIAVAEQQESRLLLEASKVAELDRIAEQLEKMNGYEEPVICEKCDKPAMEGCRVCEDHFEF